MSFFKPAKPPPAPAHKARPTAPTSGAGPDLLFERLPQPDVVESDSDTSWDLWQDSVNPNEAEDANYKDTEPMGLVEDFTTKKPQGPAR